VNILLRAYSFLFLLPITLFFLAIGSFSVIEGTYDLNLDMLPWSGPSLTYWILGLSLFGLLSMVLALRKSARLLFVLFALAVFVLAMYATFLSPHRFDGFGAFQWALAFCAGALGAFFGALMHAFRR